MPLTTIWRGALLLGLIGGLGACTPQPPLEVVTEQPDFTTGSTQPATARTTLPPSETAPTNLPSTSRNQTQDITEDPFTEIVATGPLVERLPNTCRLQNYQQFIGQNASVLASAALDRAWRVVGPNSIVTQEYNPDRLNFRTSGGGVIQRISCG